MLKGWEELGPGVFISRDRSHFPDEDRVEWLKVQAARNPRQRARWCAHVQNEDALQEMLVAIRRGSILPAHLHRGKPESLLVVEGKAHLQFFDERGKITERHPLGERGSGRPFYFRIPAGTYHSLELESEYFVFHEVTLGPWKKEDTVVAPWDRGSDA